jgi:hypothetical protein
MQSETHEDSKMKTLNVTGVTAILLGLALASTVSAQSQDFPRERTSAKSCADVAWNEKMLRSHPSLVSACKEVIEVNGDSWARFAAKLVRVEPNGDVIFSVRDTGDRSIEQVVLVPAPDQVAYINDRPTPFARLRPTDTISLYVPEGQYGFATKPGAPPEQLAEVIVPTETMREETAAPVATTETVVAQRETRPAVLPSTAGPLPWLMLGGILSLLGGMGLTLRRRI